MRIGRLELRALAGDALTDREVTRSEEPGWLTGELCSTVEAAGKLRDYFGSHPRPWEPVTEGQALGQLHFVGDQGLHLIAADVLASLPPPVARYAIDRATFIAAGLRLGGFCGPRPNLGDPPRPWVIVLAAPPPATFDILRSLIAHEVCHCWLGKEPSPTAVAGGAAWHSVMLGPVGAAPEAMQRAAAAIVAEDKRQERLARRLLASWGFEHFV